MPQSKRKSIPVTKEGEAVAATPSNATPQSTRRSSRIASRRKIDVNDCVSSDHGQSSTPSTRKQKTQPAKTKKSLQKVVIEIPAPSSRSQHQPDSQGETTLEKTQTESLIDGTNMGGSLSSLGITSATTTPKNRKTRVIAETPGMYETGSTGEPATVDEAPTDEAITTSIPPSQLTEEKEKTIEIKATPSRPSPKTESSHEAETPTKNPVGPTPTPKNANKLIFDDEYDFAAAAKNAKAAAAAQQTMQPTSTSDEVEMGEDDDEAPEDVDVGPSESKADLAKKTALKAAEKQEALQKKKRQERDALFKKQAEERKAATAVVAALGGVNEVEDDTAPKGQGVGTKEPTETQIPEETATPPTAKSRKRQRYTKQTIPDVLPAEFLTDTESSLEEEIETLPPAKRAKKITFGDMEKAMDLEARKRSMDERVGDTVFRVSKTLRAEDRKLPPRPDSEWRKTALQARKRKACAMPIKGKRKGFLK